MANKRTNGDVTKTLCIVDIMRTHNITIGPICANNQDEVASQHPKINRQIVDLDCPLLVMVLCPLPPEVLTPGGGKGSCILLTSVSVLDRKIKSNPNQFLKKWDFFRDLICKQNCRIMI